MDRKECASRLFQVAALTLTLIAVCQELEKPAEERKWHGKVVGFVPYDFRLPTIERLKESFWNPYGSRLLTPSVFGLGWGINFYALLENLGLIGQRDVSEQGFLMPSKSIKDVLRGTQGAGA